MKEDQQNPDTPDQAADAEFMKQFQQMIEGYAAAVESGKTEEADQAAMSAFMLAGMRAMNHPTPSLKLALEAQECERAGDWLGAESAHRARLVLEEKTGNDGLITKPNLDLSLLFRLLGNLDDAWTFALAATASARRAGVSILTAMALENEAQCALDKGDIGRALDAAEEALNTLEPDKITEQARAKALTMRARCEVAAGKLGEAETDLKSACELMETRGPLSFAAGPVLLRARWWETKAELLERKGELAMAATSQKQAVEQRRLGAERNLSGSLHPKAAMARSLDSLSVLLRRIGEEKAAVEAGAEARTIWGEIHLTAKGA
jgi:tetratricopeptide (TPR) repeat protein